MGTSEMEFLFSEFEETCIALDKHTRKLRNTKCDGKVNRENSLNKTPSNSVPTSLQVAFLPDVCTRHLGVG